MIRVRNSQLISCPACIGKTDQRLSVLIRVSIAVAKHYNHKQVWEERVYFTLCFINPSLREARTGSQGRNLEAGSETGHGGVLFTGLLIMACLACFLTAHRTASKCPPPINSRQENTPQVCSQAVWWVAFF